MVSVDNREVRDDTYLIALDDHAYAYHERKGSREWQQVIDDGGIPRKFREGAGTRECLVVVVRW